MGPLDETKPPCPRCESPLIVKIANAWHCNACGFDFGVENNQVAKISRGPGSGWPSRP